MLSVVIPAYNEEENVKVLYTQLKKQLTKLKEKHEIIFVDDGSRDNTYQILKQIANKDRNLKIIRFKRNFGQSAAISAGFQHAKGNIIITMDADLQNDPSDIPKILKKINEGYDVVCGWRRKRKDPFFKKKLPSMISNYIASKLTDVKIHDFGCTLRGYRKIVVDDMAIYGEMHRYIPALASFEGYSVEEIEVEHHPRLKGKTKYGMFRIFKGLSDLITLSFMEKYGTRPGHVFSSLGLFVSVLGVLLLASLIIFDRLSPAFNLANRTFLFISIMMMLGGIQFITIGVLGELITRIRYEILGKKFYKIKEVVNE